MSGAAKPSRRGLVLSALLGAAAFLLVSRILHPHWVSGSSMSPAYVDGEYVRCKARSPGDPLEPGTVVVLRHGALSLIKRVAAAGGDVLYYDPEARAMYVSRSGNGPRKLLYSGMDSGGIVGPEGYGVPDGAYFCIGDNVNHSSDSREFGAVPDGDIRYVVAGKLLRKAPDGGGGQ